MDVGPTKLNEALTRLLDTSSGRTFESQCVMFSEYCGQSDHCSDVVQRIQLQLCHFAVHFAVVRHLDLTHYVIAVRHLLVTQRDDDVV